MRYIEVISYIPKNKKQGEAIDIVLPHHSQLMQSDDDYTEFKAYISESIRALNAKFPKAKTLGLELHENSIHCISNGNTDEKTFIILVKPIKSTYKSRIS